MKAIRERQKILRNIMPRLLEKRKLYANIYIYIYKVVKKFKMEVLDLDNYAIYALAKREKQIIKSEIEWIDLYNTHVMTRIVAKIFRYNNQLESKGRH